MKKKILTILIPAFNSLSGVKRIVDVFQDRNDVEIIVSDDSNNPESSRCIKNYINKFGKSDFKYVKHISTNNPVDNWNFLLKKATGDYFVLTHHDECFTNDSFIDYLKANNDLIDMMILPISIKYNDSLSRNVSSWMQKILVSIFSKKTPLHNFIMGPSALLILKRRHLTFLNPKLKRNVDVEWYFRIFSNPNVKNINFFNQTKVLSFISENSITASIKNDLKSINQNEYKLISSEHPNNIFTNKSIKGLFYEIFFKFLISPSFIPFYLKSLFIRIKSFFLFYKR